MITIALVRVRCFLALAFLPIDDVVDEFEELVDDDGILQSLVSYFENTYIGPIRGRGSSKRRLEPTFQKSLLERFSPVPTRQTTLSIMRSINHLHVILPFGSS